MMHILKDGKPYEVSLDNELDTELMEEWLKDANNRRVGYHALGAGLRLSTVFLSVDHGFGGRPLWFESMVLDENARDHECIRYETIQEARIGHANLLRIWKKKKRQLKKYRSRQRQQERKWHRQHKDKGAARRFIATEAWANQVRANINKPALLPQMLKKVEVSGSVEA
jgi:hypothetical protein